MFDEGMWVLLDLEISAVYCKRLLKGEEEVMRRTSRRQIPKIKPWS